MSGEIAQSEVYTYGFMVANLVVVAIGLVWAWRRGMFKDLDETMHTALGLPADPSNVKENEHV
jgi:hypothetical protein